MIESQRRAYLEALGYDVWSLRPTPTDSRRLLLQPGEGSVLLVCDSPHDCESLLAGDIARALGDEVVWAWPDPEAWPENPALDEAIGQCLFTQAVLFGAELHGRLLGGEEPLVIGSARIVKTHSLAELTESGSARQSLWNQLCGRKATGSR